jgi:hypothetical protein
MTDLPAPIRVLVHWYKHTLAETRGGGVVRTLDGRLEEYGDPDNCMTCVAILLGMEYPTPEQLLEAAELVQRNLQSEAKRRGYQP